MICIILHFKSNLPTTGIYIYCVYCTILQYLYYSNFYSVMEKII